MPGPRARARDILVAFHIIFHFSTPSSSPSCCWLSRGLLRAQATSYTVTLVPPEHGKVQLTPPPPADGNNPAGSVVTVAATPDQGYALGTPCGIPCRPACPDRPSPRTPGPCPRVVHLTEAAGHGYHMESSA